MLVKSRDFFVPILVKSRVFGGHLAKKFFFEVNLQIFLKIFVS
jgi:hypothetical protein